MDGRALVGRIVDLIVEPLVLLIFSAGILLFTWGLITFLNNMESPEGRKTGVSHMIWGIIGVFIMATVLGIINIITDTFGLDIPRL